MCSHWGCPPQSHSEQNLAPDVLGAPVEAAVAYPRAGPGEFSFVLALLESHLLPMEW